MQVTLFRNSLLLSLFLFIGIGINTAHATEQEELALIVKQLSQIKQSLLRSEIVASTEQTGRYHFNYQAAQSDINEIMQGMERYMSPDRVQPRSLNYPVINGEYSEVQSNE